MAEKIGLEAILEMSSFTKGMKQYNSGIDDMTDKTEKGSDVFSKVGTVLSGIAKVGIGAAVAGFGALTAIIADSVGEAANAQAVDAQLDAVLKATGGTAGVTKDEILKLADSLSRVTPFEDDMIAATETVLLQFRHIGKDVFPQATEMALDLATRLGIDTTSAAKLLGKALEEPGEGLARLKQAGIAFTDEQEAMIKKMVESGDTAGAQKYIMDRLGESIGGAARAAGDTFAGKMTILQNSIGNVKETIGAAFLPVLTELVDKFSAFVQDNAPAIEAFFQGLADWVMNKAIPALLEIYNWLATYLPPAIQALSDFWTNTLQPALAAIWNFILVNVIPVLTEVYNWLSVNLPIAIQILSDFWTNTLQPALLAVWEFIQTSIIPALLDLYNWLATNIPPAIQTLSDFWTGTLQPALQAVWDFIQNNVIPIFQKVAEWFSGEGTSSTLGWVDTIKNFLGPIIDFAYQQFSFIVDWVKENWPLIQQTVETVMTKIKEVIDAVLTVVKKIVETTLGAIKKFWEDHGASIKRIVSDVWEIIKKTIDTVIKTIAGIIKAVMQIINGDWEGAWNTIKETVGRLWEGIKTVISTAFDAVKEIFTVAKGVLEDLWNKLWDAIKAAAQKKWDELKGALGYWLWTIGEFFRNAWGTFAEWGKNIIDGIIKGVNENFRRVRETFEDWISRLVGWIRKLLGLGSPSKVFAEIGEQVTAGLALGLGKGFKVPVTAVLEGIQDVKDAVSGELGAGVMMGYNRQALTPAYATSQNVNVSFGDTTINSGLDAEVFQARVLQTVTRAVRGY